MGKSNYRGQRYLKINLRFSEKIKNDTYSKCDVKCRIVSRKKNYNDSVPQQVFPRESFHRIFPEPSSGSETRTRNFTMIFCSEQGTCPKLCPPARFSPAEISLFSILPEQNFHKKHPESGKADPKPA